MPINENLFSGGDIHLFGRVFTGLTLADTAGSVSPTHPLATQLAAPGAQLARIYGFSYRGSYYKLGEPTVMLVHGPGMPVPSGAAAVPLSLLGVEFKEQTFADEVLVWVKSEADYSLRIDISTGWLQDILIAAETGDDSGSGEATGRGQMVGRGQMTGG